MFTVGEGGGLETSASAESRQPDAGTVEWRKARLPDLLRSTTAEEALADIVLGCVEHLRGNEACVLARAHEEGVHQMRVAVRRLRSCLALYRRFIPAEQHDHLVGELKWLIGELGPARDWDVFVGEILKPVVRQFGGDDERLADLGIHVERHRDEAYERAQTAVAAQRYLGLVLLLSSWAEGRGWRNAVVDAQTEALQSDALHTAHDLLQQIFDDLLATGDNFEQLDPEARHKVRIQLKKLRYATEFFSSLYSKRKATPYLAAMKALQDALGTSNDVDVAKKLLRRTLKGTRGKERARLSYAAGLVVGWHGHVGDGREQQVVGAWYRLTERAPYWETPILRTSGTGSDADDIAPEVAAAGAPGEHGAPSDGAAADAPQPASTPMPRRRRVSTRAAGNG
jgi:triphosphatase